jgi:hypothetical protein
MISGHSNQFPVLLKEHTTFNLQVFNGPRRRPGTHYPGMRIISQKSGVLKHTYVSADATLRLHLIFLPDLLDQKLLNDNERLR